MVLENKIEERLREIRSLINHNDDYDDNANVEKTKQKKQKQKQTVGFISKTTALHMFFSTFLWRPLYDYDVKPRNATFYGGRELTKTKFFFIFLNLDEGLLLESNSKKNGLHLTNWAGPNSRDKDWEDANSFVSLPPLSL